MSSEYRLYGAFVARPQRSARVCGGASGRILDRPRHPAEELARQQAVGADVGY